MTKRGKARAMQCSVPTMSSCGSWRDESGVGSGCWLLWCIWTAWQKHNYSNTTEGCLSHRSQPLTGRGIKWTTEYEVVGDTPIKRIGSESCDTRTCWGWIFFLNMACLYTLTQGRMTHKIHFNDHSKVTFTWPHFRTVKWHPSVGLHNWVLEPENASIFWKFCF